MRKSISRWKTLRANYKRIPKEWNKEFQDYWTGSLQAYLTKHQLELSESYLTFDEGTVCRIRIRKEDLIIFEADFKRQLSDDEILILCKSAIRTWNLNILLQ
jgi:hypothetical protein